MKLVENFPNLVIAGAWNPAILSPSWVASKAMGLDIGTNFPVNVEMAVGLPDQPIIYEFEQIKFMANRQSVTFSLHADDREQINKTISTASKILELLPHTPVTGFGFNFRYEVENPTHQLLGTFNIGGLVAGFMPNENAESVRQGWECAIRIEDRLLTLNAQLEGNRVFLTYNAHFETGNATAASEKLKNADAYMQALNDIQVINGHMVQEG